MTRATSAPPPDGNGDNALVAAAGPPSTAVIRRLAIALLCASVMIAGLLTYLVVRHRHQQAELPRPAGMPASGPTSLVAGRLVGQHYLRVLHQRAGARHRCCGPPAAISRYAAAATRQLAAARASSSSAWLSGPLLDLPGIQRSRDEPRRDAHGYSPPDQIASCTRPGRGAVWAPDASRGGTSAVTGRSARDSWGPGKLPPSAVTVSAGGQGLCRSRTVTFAWWRLR
jgi:hypothetical protein